VNQPTMTTRDKVISGALAVLIVAIVAGMVNNIAW
jgi:hypothetical protein